MISNGLDHPPLKRYPFSWARAISNSSNTWFLGPIRIYPQTASRSVKPFFAGIINVTNRQKNRPRYSVYSSNRPHLCVAANYNTVSPKRVVTRLARRVLPYDELGCIYERYRQETTTTGDDDDRRQRPLLVWPSYTMCRRASNNNNNNNNNNNI